MPWKTNIDVSSSDGVIRLNAGSSSGQWVTCRILRDDVVLAENKAVGMTTCLVSVRRAFAADRK